MATVMAMVVVMIVVMVDVVVVSTRLIRKDVVMTAFVSQLEGLGGWRDGGR